MTKKELILEAQKISIEHENKKKLIQGVFDSLDKEDKISQKHLSGISSVNEILKEMEELEINHAKILEQIKE